ncbi:hypothetical protein, partial [Paraburkholderia kirstenboschensis]|uniref:hypothetical protein n=1 Tax=Paraburkholderia kirstenboschensis TaxID=1245436 RepID=UPI001FB3B03C
VLGLARGRAAWGMKGRLATWARPAKLVGRLVTLGWYARVRRSFVAVAGSSAETPRPNSNDARVQIRSP